MLKPNLQCDGIGRWGLWEVMRSEISALIKDTPCEDTEKRWFSMKRKWPSLDTKPAGTLISDLPASRTGEIISADYELPSL